GERDRSGANLRPRPQARELRQRMHELRKVNRYVRGHAGTIEVRLGRAATLEFALDRGLPEVTRDRRLLEFQGRPRSIDLQWYFEHGQPEAIATQPRGREVKCLHASGAIEFEICESLVPVRSEVRGDYAVEGKRGIEALQQRGHRVEWKVCRTQVHLVRAAEG